MNKSSKRYKEILKNSIKDKKIQAKEAIELVKKNSTTKFDESIDISLKINLKSSIDVNPLTLVDAHVRSS